MSSRRRVATIAALLAAAAPALRAQDSSTPQAAGAKQASRTPARLKSAIDLLKTTEHEPVPPASAFTTGDRLIPAGSTVASAVGVWKGNLDVAGKVAGNAVVINGDIRVHAGGVITGDAVSVGGHVILDSGSVQGESVSLSDLAPSATGGALTSAISGTWVAGKVVVAWFAVLLIIGVGVMIFADGTLDGVVMGLERGIARAFWAGLLGQVLILPVLLVIIVGLLITIIGLLLVPFAIVAYTIVVAGLLTLGFLAIARLSGTLVARNDGMSNPRSVDLRALLFGLCGYMALWLLAAAFTWSPALGTILRGLALAVTWVAATAGFGATLLSRAGTRRDRGSGWMAAAASSQLSWQTPTPVAGVASARRPATPTGGASR